MARIKVPFEQIKDVIIEAVDHFLFKMDYRRFISFPSLLEQLRRSGTFVSLEDLESACFLLSRRDDLSYRVEIVSSWSTRDKKFVRIGLRKQLNSKAK